MKIEIHSGKLQTARTDLVVIGACGESFAKYPSFTELDRGLKGALRRAASDLDFKGKSKQQLLLPTLGKLRLKRIALVGLGNNDLDPAALLRLSASATRIGNKVGAKEVVVVVPQNKREIARVVELCARGAHLGAYRYDRYMNDKGRAQSVTRVAIALDGAAKAKAKTARALRRGAIVATAVAAARDLVNEPASDLYPESFAKRATAMARRVGLTAKVYNPAQLAKMKMGLLLGVGAGSERPPRLVHLSYNPVGKTKRKPVVLVGKGITFDSGGLSLKSTANMIDMKVDMAGAAAVFATMQAVAQLKPPMPVHGILALAENMPSGSATRLGDVLRSASGKTVEINNTDAEGRLVLGDALHYACGLKPARIIDLATLTGACVIALGSNTVGLFANDDDLATELLTCAQQSGESFWRMPLLADLKEQLKSDVADTKNTGERWGGAITASLFLKEFVGDTAWAHLDIAGPATSAKADGISTKGGTGVAVATLVDLLSH